MKKVLDLKLKPEEAFDEERFGEIIRRKLGGGNDSAFRIVKRSIDARQANVWVRVQVALYQREPVPELITYRKDYPNVSHSRTAIIVGAGPAGLFAALRLIEKGIKPVILERGKDVRSRRRDLAAINKDHTVNPNSNYCFGEGGAGTYSDGKLYTRSKKRGDIQRVLEILVAHGAREDILYDAHPHIGTNKLPNIVTALRESILTAGGEVHFDSCVKDFVIEGNELKGVKLANNEVIKGEGVILATGHSARDIFELLHARKVKVEAKPFALGVRIEHPQALIDKIQYSCVSDRGPYLPASAYSLVSQTQVNNKKKGVFSFCMCPGGFIVPAATSPGEIVVNGMSPSRRDSQFANSGIVAAVELDDLQGYEKYGELSAMYFQRAIEQKAFSLTGGGQTAPAQRMVDFVEKKISGSLLETSYQPGLQSVDMEEVLPKFVAQSLRQGFRDFGKKMKGYFTNEAQIIGVESRTSSPIRIPRNKESLEHVELRGLFPCGEGAGYAGGIVSAAMDGERCAEALLNKIPRQPARFTKE